MVASRVLWLVPAVWLLSITPALPCSCTGVTEFREALKTASVVVLGQVVSVGELRRGDGKPDPQMIELAVRHSIKGSVSSPRIQVWNDMAGSSCGGMLLGLVVGLQAVVALSRVGDVESSRQRLWDLLNFRAGKGDYLAEPSACGQAVQLVQTESDARRWSRRRIN